MEKALLKVYQKAILAGLFLVFLLVAAFNYNDYGVPWDEPNQIEIGKFNYDYLTTNSDTLVSYHDRFYGAAYEMPIYALTKALNIHSTASVLAFRHLANHLLFLISLGFFFTLLFKLFQSFNSALLGTLMLYLHPRIFAHSFFNSKDLIFMSVFVIGLFTLFLLFEKQNKKRILFHALISALLIDIRILGVILPFISLLVFLPTLFKRGKESANYIHTLSLYAVFTIILIYVFWPALWTDPLLLGKSFVRMSHFPFQYDVLFNGSLIPAQQIPWTYIPVWIGISTPPFILLLMMIGFIILIHDYLKNPESAFFSTKQWFILVLATFPIDFSILLILISSTLYDGWRQVFFLYPMLLIAAVYALQQIIIKSKVNKFWRGFTFGLIAVFIILTIKKIAYLHPYEHVYFNHFVSKKNENRRKSFEMDYWGLSYREGIDYVLENDKAKKIRIYFDNAAGPNNILYFPKKEQNRIIVVNSPDSADYFMGNYRYHPEDYQYGNEVFKVERNQNRLLSVFKLKGK